ncbi:MAG TPA: hypothetical protein PKA62_16625, partial [Thermoanaerobaculia bacterium]|nr:hypothetical protein [Thermoanaerobaculia bacterium]
RSRLSIALLSAATVVLPSPGCVSTAFRPSPDHNIVACPPVEPSSVRVLSRPPQEPFTVLGEVEADVSGHSSEEEIVSRLRAKAAEKGAHAIFFARDVSMETAEKWTTGEYDAPLNDRTWRKRSSLVFKAVLLSDAPEPCPGVGRPAPIPGGATTAVPAATDAPPGGPRSSGR